MNGVRRFLTGNATGPDPPQLAPVVPVVPLSLSSRPSWPPTDNGQTTNGLTESPVSTTSPLLLKRDRQQPRGDDQPQPSSSRADSVQPPLSPPKATRKPPPNAIPLTVDRRNGEDAYDTRDELLLSLLASEAVAECQEHEILSSEQVEELKKEYQALSSRLAGLKKKLTLETKIRDAALSLARVNAPFKGVSKQTTEQVDTANFKVESVQKDVWVLSEQVNEIRRRLMEHRASVLTHSLKRLEKSHHSTPPPMMNGSSLPPVISPSSDPKSSSVHTRFEHFFAGHSDSVVPQPLKKPPSDEDLAALEEKFNAVTRELAQASKQQTDLARDLSLLKLEKEQLQTTLEMELQTAEAQASSLGSELVQYKGEVEELRRQQEVLELTKVELEERKEQIESLKQQLEAADLRSGEASETSKQVMLKEQELAKLRAEVDAALRAKDLELAELNTRFELERASWRDELAPTEEASAILWAVVQEHDIPLPNDSDATIPVLAESISFFIESTLNTIRELRDSVREQREISNALRESRVEAEALRKEVQYFENQSREQSDRIVELIAQQTSSSTATLEYRGDAATLIAALAPVWAILPSAEARAAKLGQNRFRTTSPTQSPAGSSMKQSLSEMDVRGLKALYDGTKVQSRPATPGSPGSNSITGFTIEAFVARVQSLIADDRALIERLVRFAQAHDLLKKNAERAQKLAMDSSAALETYQRQVRTLEERDSIISDQNAELQDEVAQLQEVLDRLEAERRELEQQATEQAETCRQLTAANASLSAQSLSLADEITVATNAIRKQMEAQLALAESKLARANEENDAMRMSEQTQRVALLEELNAAQTENESLRAQLRKK